MGLLADHFEEFLVLLLGEELLDFGERTDEAKFLGINDHQADYFRTTLVGSVRHLRFVELLDEPLLPARTAQAAATVGATFKFLRFQMIANMLIRRLKPIACKRSLR